MKRPHPSIQVANVITGGGDHVCHNGTTYVFCCYYVCSNDASPGAANESVSMNSIAILVARVLLALLFLVSAFRQAIHRHGVEREMAEQGMMYTPFLLGCAILIELTGGLSLILGYETLWGVLELIAFTLASTFIYYRRISDRDKLIHVLKNLAIIGGLLMVAAVGPGTIGIDPATSS